jgi:hypothetical protein
MPAFKVHGKTVAGRAAFKNHLSYMPHSRSVLSTPRAGLARLSAIALSFILGTARAFGHTGRRQGTRE